MPDGALIFPEIAGATLPLGVGRIFPVGTAAATFPLGVGRIFPEGTAAILPDGTGAILPDGTAAIPPEGATFGGRPGLAAAGGGVFRFTVA